MDKILGFHNKYRFLSNFYETEINYMGYRFSSAEAAYQASKCENKSQIKRFLFCNPLEAKYLGRKVKIIDNWDEVKDNVMYEILKIKFSNPKLRKLLLETEYIELVEYNIYNDEYWGVSNKTDKGQNRLGKILMKIRDEIRKENEKCQQEH